jgi:hypothetical protein
VTATTAMKKLATVAAFRSMVALTSLLIYCEVKGDAEFGWITGQYFLAIKDIFTVTTHVMFSEMSMTARFY